MKASMTPGDLTCGLNQAGGFITDSTIAAPIGEQLLRGLHVGEPALPKLADPASVFCVVRLDEVGGTVWLWATTEILLGVRGRAQVVRGSSSTDWSQVRVPGADGAVVGDARTAKANALPAPSGLFSAGSLRLGTAARQSHDLPERAGQAEPSARPVDPTDEPPAFDMAELWGHTIQRPVEAAALRPAATDPDGAPSSAAKPSTSNAPGSGGPPSEASGPEPAGDRASEYAVHDGQTMAVGALQPRARTEMWVQAEEGGGVALMDAVIVGRSPKADVTCRSSVLALPTRFSDVSRSHLRVDRVAGGFRVTDLGSNNGSKLKRADGRTVQLVPHVALPIVVGDKVELGEGAVIFIRAVEGGG